ncbi:phosphate acetyl/butaryl transferase [Desulfovibrio sp. X2]|uniref:phosphate acyltransferase n=1 Tax=Desulfovibrio sp. X2 TaxID=941449 RepID=UPI000358AE61|nr:phosphate acyltransferase [Desulfovibrio sp. X2]EPR43360.1 phosphate acetyl/butaryl transferase [Desulfovibrio sp. X2]
MRIRSFRDLLAAARAATMPRVAVVRCAEGFVLRAAVAAYRHGVAEPILIGDTEAARRRAAELGLDISPFEQVDADDDAAALDAAIGMYKASEAALLMKGLISTATLLKAVLHKDKGVPPKGILSHVALFERPGSGRLMALTDAGVNIKPNLQRKAEIVRNAVSVLRALGVRTPRVAMLAATEKVNFPAMPATLDADLIAKMSAQGEFGPALVAGPLQLDIAVSPRAARVKGYSHPVAGRADILCVPDIESGNVLYKSLSSFSACDMAGIVAGSSVPMVVASRGDSERSKLFSLALGTYLSRCPDIS